MLTTILGQILALGVIASIGMLLSRLTRIELTLVCLLAGFIFGLSLEHLNFDTGIRAHNLKDIVFFIILPILIFEAAWHLKPTLLKRWIIPIFLLASLGVLINCLATAILVYLGIGHPTGFPIIAALLTGAILAATDPTSVISQLKSCNAPEDLTTLFEGESLLNDAGAIVVFAIILGLVNQSGEISFTNYIGYFSIVFFGGIITGILLGLASVIMILLVNKISATSFILVLTAFGSFFIAEHLLHISGILAVMSSAITIRLWLREFEEDVASGIGGTLSWLGLSITTVLFVIMGLVITLDMFKEQWLAMIIAIVSALIARIAAVTSCSYMAHKRVYHISKNWQILLVWGGLKGAVAIALALSLPSELPYWWTIQSMVFGVVLFSLLVQGTTNISLIKKYG